MDECAKNRSGLAAGFRACRGLISALGDDTRQQIVIAFLESEQAGLRVGEVAARTHLSRPTVSHHLKILKDAGVVTVRRRGTMNFYYMDADDAPWSKLQALIDQVTAIVAGAKDEGYPPPQDDE